MAEGSAVRLPLQGGLPPVGGVTGPVVEIVCDESGFSGSNLLDVATPVITHASVDLGRDEAVEMLTTLRSGLRYSLSEYKAGRLLRSSGAGESLAWFLAELSGRAHVQLVDKEYFLVTRMVDLFLAEPSYAAGTRLTEDQRPAALVLYRARSRGGPDWAAFLGAFVALVRTRRHRMPDRGAVRRFFAARDALAAHDLGAMAGGVLDGLRVDTVWTVLVRLTRDDRTIPPPLEPMLPALAETVLSWCGGARRVLVVHDEQSALTADRLRRIQRLLAEDTIWSPAGLSPFAGLVAVDSRDDPRVQVADLLAGLARRSEQAGVETLLAPFVSPTSLHDPGEDS